MPISVVCEIRDRAATILRNAGYIAAVQVPEQRIADGIVRFQVLMAHLTQVRVRGDATGAETDHRRLSQPADQAAGVQPLRSRALPAAGERPARLHGAPDLAAGRHRRRAMSSATSRSSALPAYADFNIQNGGSKALGRWGGLLRGQVFGLTGLGDRTTVSVFTHVRLQGAADCPARPRFPSWPQGLGISGSFTYAWARPTIPDAHVLAKTLLGTVEVDYPFVRRQA